MHNAQRMTCRWETSERVGCCFVEVCAADSPWNHRSVECLPRFVAEVAAIRAHLGISPGAFTAGNTGTK